MTLGLSDLQASLFLKCSSVILYQENQGLYPRSGTGQLQRHVTSGISTQNPFKVSDYDNKLIREPYSWWQFLSTYSNRKNKELRSLCAPNQSVISQDCRVPVDIS
jgi:hypothetical protein